MSDVMLVGVAAYPVGVLNGVVLGLVVALLFGLSSGRGGRK